MADELVFYTNPMSRGRTVRWMLEEVGQPYRTEVMEYGTTMKSPEYLAINPMGKVPALCHGDTVVTECAAICAYLADAFPEAGLAPSPTSRLRGTYYRWMFFTAGPLEAVVINKALGFEVPSDKKGMAGFGDMTDVVNALETAVTGKEFIVGNRFSAVDVYLGASVGWTMQFGMLEKRPALEAYVARLMARPANIRARAIDDALLPPKPAAS